MEMADRPVAAPAASDRRAVLPEPLPRLLNLGCGQFPIDGYLNVDADPLARCEFLFDLDALSQYRIFPSDHFDRIVMRHSLEHLRNVFGTMRSLHRMLRPGGILEIQVPHFSRGITHPEHQHGFDVTFPEYFNPAFKGGFTGTAFELVSMRLDYMIRWDLKKPIVLDWQIAILKVVHEVMSRLANLQPYACSRFWCYLVGGFEQIEYVFRKPAT